MANLSHSIFKASLIVGLFMTVNACSGSGSPDPAASQPDSRASLVQKVNELENQLKAYGVHFEVRNETRSDDSYGYNPYRNSRTSVVVQMRTTATDQDLVTAGLKPEQRDELLRRTGDLWSEIQFNHLENENTNEAVMAAVLKVKLARDKIERAKFIESYLRARQIENSGDVLVMERSPLTTTPAWDSKKSEGDLSLWRENSTPMSNAEAIAAIDERVALNAKFEGGKVWANAKINDLRSADRSANAELIELLNGAVNFEFLTRAEIENMTALKADLATLPPNDRLDTVGFSARNDRIISAERAALTSAVDQIMNSAMDRMGIRFVDAANGLQLDAKSVAEAKVKGTYVTSPADATTAIRGKLERLSALLKKYGNRSVEPANEKRVSEKLRLFLTL